MSAGGILHKIAARGEGLPTLSLERSILAHLAVLLNTRQGFCSQDPSFGMPDFTDLAHNLPAGIPSLRAMIGRAIERYEPRLCAVEVRSHKLSKDCVTLSFEVHAKLDGGGAFCFQTQVFRSGVIHVG